MSSNRPAGPSSANSIPSSPRDSTPSSTRGSTASSPRDSTTSSPRDSKAPSPRGSTAQPASTPASTASASTPPRPRFRPARQARSQQTLERILDAARAIVRDVGLDGLTVNEVTRRSAVTTGSFYARFAGRDALVHWLENRYWEEVEERWRAFLEPGRWSERTVAERVDGLVRGVCRSYHAGAAELRIFLLHSCANPDGKPLRRVMVLEEGVAARVASLLAPWDGVSHPEPARAAAFATEQLLAALRGEVLVGKGAVGKGAVGKGAVGKGAVGKGTPTFSTERADDERVRAFGAYLGLSAPARPSVT